MIIKLNDEKDNLGIKGKDLLTRPIADRFVPRVISMLKNMKDESEPVEFSFEEIQTADTSFIDQLIIVKVLESMQKKKLKKLGVFLSGLSPSTHDNAGSVFGKKEIPILVKVNSNKFELFGHLENNLARVLRVLMIRKQLRAVEIRKEQGVDINVASTKLYDLYKKGLATRKEKITEKGREYIYFALF